MCHGALKGHYQGQLQSPKKVSAPEAFPHCAPVLYVMRALGCCRSSPLSHATSMAHRGILHPTPKGKFGSRQTRPDGQAVGWLCLGIGWDCMHKRRRAGLIDLSLQVDEL